MKLNHISIIVSSERAIQFYNCLGFSVKSREKRAKDELVYMANEDIVLEIYIDPTHPARAIKPEALGLRHICLSVPSVEVVAAKWGVEQKRDRCGNFCFIYDPDSLPIEIRENEIL